MIDDIETDLKKKKTYRRFIACSFVKTHWIINFNSPPASGELLSLKNKIMYQQRG